MMMLAKSTIVDILCRKSLTRYHIWPKILLAEGRWKSGNSFTISTSGFRNQRVCFMMSAKAKLQRIPSRYSDMSTKALWSAKNMEINSTYTGSRAEQLINGTISIVRARSLGSGMSLAAMIAGTLQSKPISMGINERPCNPSLCISPSVKKATRAI